MKLEALRMGVIEKLYEIRMVGQEVASSLRRIETKTVLMGESKGGDSVLKNYIKQRINLKEFKEASKDMDYRN